MANHAEIDNCQTAIGLDKKIARVWIGMEETKLRKLPQSKASEIFGDLFKIDVCRSHSCNVINLYPCDAFDGQHLRGG